MKKNYNQKATQLSTTEVEKIIFLIKKNYLHC